MKGAKIEIIIIITFFIIVLQISVTISTGLLNISEFEIFVFTCNALPLFLSTSLKFKAFF